MDFQRKLIETIDSADVFKKLKQRDQKKCLDSIGRWQKPIKQWKKLVVKIGISFAS
jgi:hypothetical protein